MCGPPNDSISYYTKTILNRNGLWCFGYKQQFTVKDGDTMSVDYVASHVKTILKKLLEHPEDIHGFEQFYRTCNPITITSIHPLHEVILDSEVEQL